MDDRAIRMKPDDSAPPPFPWDALSELRHKHQALTIDVDYFLKRLERAGDPLSKLGLVHEFLREHKAAIAGVDDQAETLSLSLRHHGYPTAGGSTADVGARP